MRIHTSISLARVHQDADAGFDEGREERGSVAYAVALVVSAA